MLQTMLITDQVLIPEMWVTLRCFSGGRSLIIHAKGYKAVPAFEQCLRVTVVLIATPTDLTEPVFSHFSAGHRAVRSTVTCDPCRSATGFCMRMRVCWETRFRPASDSVFSLVPPTVVSLPANEPTD